MKIVIDIPEEIYDTIMDDQMLSREQLEILHHHIYYGQPLPKGHGRLIDADAFFQEFSELDTEPYTNAPTIIEADKEGKP